MKPSEPGARKQIVMPVIVVTRLRLRDAALPDEFFTDAVAAIERYEIRRQPRH
jgi:hypothetical protein